MKKILSITLIFVMILSVFNIGHADNIKLNDIENHWAKSNIEQLINLGIVDGYLDGTFKPDNTLKFEEFIKMLVTATEKDEIKLAEGEKWYKPYIDIALENNYIIKDMDKLIGTNVDRKTMAEIIYNLIASTDGMIKLSEKEIKFVVSNFSDLKITDEKVLHIASMGIINGYPDKTFKPNDNLKRSEATTVILRILDESKRTPMEIILPKELSDFPEPDLNYLYNYLTVEGITAKEDYELLKNEKYQEKIPINMLKPPIDMCKQITDNNKNFIELLVNRDYRTINEPRTLLFYSNGYFQKSSENKDTEQKNTSYKKLSYEELLQNYNNGEYEGSWKNKYTKQKSLSYKDWLLYYMNGVHEYCGDEYYYLKRDFLDFEEYTDKKNEKEKWIKFADANDLWFENFQDKFINDTINNEVIVTGKFYTAEDLYVSADSNVATRGILRFKFENHNNPSNIKEELNLVMKKVTSDGMKLSQDKVSEDARDIYLDYSEIGDIKVGQWYEIGMDVVVRSWGKAEGIDKILGGSSNISFGYIYPIYIKELK